MAKKIRFPLNMNGAEVRTIEELRENFDIESVLGYFANGKLVTWLRDRYYDNEAMSIEALSVDDTDLKSKISSILGVSAETDDNEVDMETIQRRNEKLMKLRQITDDKEIIDNVDRVAMNQDDLLDLLDEGVTTIYLFQGEFSIPLTVKNVTYIGSNTPIVLLRAYDNVNFAATNIKFKNICFGWDVSSVTSNDRLYQAERMFLEQRFTDAIPILEQLVSEDNPKAINDLAQIYEQVYPTADNKKKMSELHERSAELGDVFGYIEKSKSFEGTEKLLLALIAKGNATAAQYFGFVNYVNGKTEIALKYWEIAAEKNDRAACGNIGLFYMETESFLPIEMRSNQKAVYYLQKGISLGNAKAAQKLGYMYDKLQNYEEAFRYHKIAAEKGLALSQNYIGYSFEIARGILKNDNEAIKWYKKAAEQGDAVAQNNLGNCYYDGQVTIQDYDEAIKWYRKSAEQGNDMGIHDLAVCYHYGKGTMVNRSKAIELYRQAAKMGLKASQDALRKMGESW